MTTDNQAPKRPSFGSRLWKAFKNLVIFLFRVLLVLVIIGAVGAAIYFGAPVLIEEYILKDVRSNSSRIEDINAQLANDNEKINERITALQTRTESLEILSDTNTQIINELQAQLAAAENTMQDQTATIESLQALGVMLDEHDEVLSSLEEGLSTFEAALEALEDELSDVNQSIDSNRSEIEALITELETRDTSKTLRQDLQLLKVMELITRARVSIGQENIGLAKDDLQTAQDLLAGLRTTVSPEQAAYLDEIAQRLALATDNISDSVSLAEEDLEVAWQLLLSGLPESPTGDEIEATPTQKVEEDVESTPTPTPTPTPEP